MPAGKLNSSSSDAAKRAYGRSATLPAVAHDYADAVACPVMIVGSG
jgi:hypothetical protein